MLIYLKRAIRILLYTVLVLLVFAASVTAVLTLTERGRENLAGLISDFASSPDQGVKVSGISGIWSGALKVDSVVLSDKDGAWLVARGVAVDWSPLALVSARFDADRIAAERIEVARMPASGGGSSGGGSGSLPVSLAIRDLDFPDVRLGEALAGGVAGVSAKGSLTAEASPIRIDTDLVVRRTDKRAGSVTAAINFAPGDNLLDLNIQASEPRGGIIANLLKLPGEPAVDISAMGSGPAADWKGSGTVSIDGAVVIRLDGAHRLLADGSAIKAKGSGDFARFLPERFRPLLQGQTAFDVAGVIGNDGGFRIERSEIKSDALTGTAKGTVNPAGATDFALEFSAARGGLPLSFGTDESPLDIDISSASIRALGDGRTPALDMNFVLPSFATNDTQLTNVALALHSDEFDLNARSGPVSGNLAADALVIDNANIAPLVSGKVSAELAGVLSTEAFAVESGAFRSDAMGGQFSGNVGLNDGTIELALKADVASSALPVAARPALGERVQISADLARDSEGNVSANSLSVTSGGLSGGGAIKLTEQAIDADIKGRIAEISAIAKSVSGAVDFALTASGDKNIPDVAATITSDSIAASGRELRNLSLTAKGKADAASPLFDVVLSGDLSGQPLEGKAAVNMAETGRGLSGLSLSVGANRITGDLVLDEGFVPLGKLALDLQDPTALAGISNSDLKAALRGTAMFEKQGDRPNLVVDAKVDVSSPSFAASGVDVAATVGNYMAAPDISASINAAQANAGTTAVRDIAVALRAEAAGIGFDAGATMRDIPAKAAGLVRTIDGGVAIDLTSADATVSGIETALAQATTITNAGGVTRLDGLTIDLDGGRAVVSGTAGETLDLNIQLSALPAALANRFAPDLAAAGTIAGTIKVTGPSSTPNIAYDLAGTGVEMAQTRGGTFGALDLTAKGTFAEDTVSFDANAKNAAGIALAARGTARPLGETIEADIQGELADVAPLAAGATGAIDFSVKASGSRAAPDLAVTVSSQRLRAAEREITGLTLTATGKADAANPAASVTLAGNVAGQALAGSANLSTGNGKRTINGLSVTLGQNRITGDLELDDAFVPIGAIDFTVPDIGPLAALVFEEISGNINGNARFTREAGKPRIAVDARVGDFRRGEIAGKDISVTATIDDYLAAPLVAGRVQAASINSGTTMISGIAIDLTRDGAWTGFDGGATVSGIPAKAKGRVQAAKGTTTIELSSAEAVVQGIKAALAKPGAVRIANGATTLEGLTLDVGGGQAVVTGTAGEALNIDVRLSRLPASLANRFAAGLDASGTISGTVKVTGPASAPNVAYDVTWSGAQTSQTRGAGFGALNVASKGTFANQRVAFDATASDGSGMALKANGTVQTTGSGALSVDLTGRVPFGFLASRLAAQGLSLTGGADVNIQVRGTTAAPVIGGSVRAAGARFIDAGSGIAVGDLNGDISIANGIATVRSLTGTLSTGGTITAGGTVSLDAARGLPADLTIRIAEGRYTDGRVVTATLSGDLAVKGALMSAPTLSGTINLGRTVITVPEKLPTSLSTLNVKHKNATAAVRKQDAELNPPSAASGGGGGGLALDITVNANNQIFIQGRGLDAELGGSLRLIGPATSPEATGQFTLRRGRLSVLGKRLTFTRGTITFSGSMVPYIDFAADSSAGDSTVTVTISGPANNPKFLFSSIPALPEDEVLARLIFGRSMSNLSPLQIAQLAEAAAQFAGVGGSTSLLDKLRSNIGIDDLDVRTDEKGGTAVSAGKYLNDRTYVTIEKGDKPGSGKATIDLNVGRGVKLRGQASDGGEAKGGIFFEREY